MLSWKFYINNIEVEEPQGWDGVEFSLKRNPSYFGLDDAYTEDVFTFDAKGAQLLREEFAITGFDGSLPFRIQQYCAGELTGQFNWSINLMTYEAVNNEVSVRAEDTAFKRRFATHIDTKVSLNSEKSIGGVALPAVPLKEIKLHSKEITSQGKLTFSSSPYHREIQGPGGANLFITPLFDTISTDQDFGVNLPFAEISDGLAYYFNAQTSDVFDIKFNLTASITADFPIGVLVLVLLKKVGGVEFAPIEFPIDPSFTFNYDDSIAMIPGDYFHFDIRIARDGISDDIQNVFIDYTSGYFEVISKTNEPGSACKGYLIHQTFKRLAELITDEADCFKSEFFGTTDQFPFYNEDGCGADVLITNGKAIRNMLQEDGSAYPISMSFMELYKACDAVWCLGMRIEYNDYGKAFVRVEPREYFYNLDQSLSLSNVADIRTKAAIEKVYNSVEIGYEKWNLNLSQKNGIDEYNSKHFYSLPVTNGRQKLMSVSSFIASGYVIEQTRRVQFRTNRTDDFETDDRNFFICLNKEEVTSAVYEGVFITYAKRTVSERNENFPFIDFILYPETVYNLRISPTRNLIRHYRFLASSLFYKLKISNATEIKFQSGEGNILAEDELQSCDEASGIVKQNMSLKPMDVLNPSPLYRPEYISFEYPLTMDQFNIMHKNSDKSISVSCDGVNYISGYIENIGFKPNSENGMSSITLLRAGDNLGAFDSGFSDGFDI